MAMGYGNAHVDRAFSGFIGAVAQTGFELRRLDQKPKAGLIDLRMRVEIRSAKFLVADLTDENRGAYWEAGFAEGLGKKVYYTCEASKFDKAKTHFDTEQSRL
jgi:nucleoside 2-deoxyribosyltransferase